MKCDLPLLLMVLLVFFALTSCQNENEYVPVEPISEKERFIEFLKSSISQDSTFSQEMVNWQKTNPISINEKYMVVTVPVEDGGKNIGEIMFEVTDTLLVKKFILFDKLTTSILAESKDENLDVHDMLTILNKKKLIDNVTSRSSCIGCHSPTWSIETDAFGTSWLNFDVWPINLWPSGITDLVTINLIPTSNVNKLIDNLRTDTGISLSQANWLKSPYRRPVAEDLIIFWDSSSKYSSQRQFVHDAITSLQNGGHVDFTELFIETSTPDDNYNYQGGKSFIPNPLVLSNGDRIDVTFGRTKSDNQSANQKVANDVIDGMKFAIREANKNLSAGDKITSIHVHCTTNGQHSPTSNHSKATAVDISRINGRKMIQTGVTNQIKELQKAMDKFPYVRENFGPHFKHKYSREKPSQRWNYNHPVGGHKDHIHFSTRR